MTAAETWGGFLGRSNGAVVTVSGGRFSQCYQLAAIVFSASSGFTVLGFDRTTNPGGQYKVWVSTSPTFSSDTSVTDNFSVRELVLSVTLASFAARRSSHGVVVSWRTGTEASELGFNVYRQQGARRVRLNRRLIPAVGAVAGASYRFTDRRAPGHTALRYYLQDVSVSGARVWHGPVRVAAA